MIFTVTECLFSFQAGCIIIPSVTPAANTSSVCVVLLIYSQKKQTFIGVIPDNQQQFIIELRV